MEKYTRLYQTRKKKKIDTKKIFDLVVAILSLILASPVMLICAILSKCQSPGPIFYRAQRVGLNSEFFSMYKFRTMVANADSIGDGITAYHDERITRIGRFLRKTKLDELPQLFNVLRGEMSIIGPRPEAPEYVKFYTEKQRDVLKVRPGITGPSQIENRDEKEKLKRCDNPEKYYVNVLMPEKLEIDLQYVRNHCLKSDLKFLFETIIAILWKKGGN